MAAPVFDAVSSLRDGSGTATVSWSHTCSGSDRALIVSVFFDASLTVSTVTYNGVALTRIGGISDGTNKVDQWKLSNPASGANTVAVTTGGGFGIIGAAISFTGAHQTTASLTGTQATATGSNSSTISVNVGSASDEIVVDAAGFSADPTLTVGDSQTERWKRGFNEPDNFNFVGSTEAGAATVTMSWTTSAGVNWLTCGVSVKPVITLQTVIPTAIGSAEAFGSDQLNFTLLNVGNIASLQAFGSANLAQDVILLLAGIPSLEAFGLANMAQDVIVVAVAVPSGEAFGSPVIVLLIGPSGIIGAEAFGGHFVHFEIPFDLDLNALLVPDLEMDVTAQVFSLPNVEEVDFTVSLTPDMELDVTHGEWDFSVTVN